MQNPAPNRRLYQRIAVNIPASIFLKKDPKKKFEGEVIDISVGGAFVHCTIPVLIGEEVLVEIHFSDVKVMEARVIDYEDWVQKQAPEAHPEPSVVRWARGTSVSGFGIEFVGLAEDKKVFLERLVDYYDRLTKAGVSFVSP